jgi:hypothetical protein
LINEDSNPGRCFQFDAEFFAGDANVAANVIDGHLPTEQQEGIYGDLVGGS